MNLIEPEGGEHRHQKYKKWMHFLPRHTTSHCASNGSTQRPTRAASLLHLLAEGGTCEGPRIAGSTPRNMHACTMQKGHLQSAMSIKPQPCTGQTTLFRSFPLAEIFCSARFSRIGQTKPHTLECTSPAYLDSQVAVCFSHCCWFFGVKCMEKAATCDPGNLTLAICTHWPVHACVQAMCIPMQARIHAEWLPFRHSSQTTCTGDGWHQMGGKGKGKQASSRAWSYP